MTPLRQYTADMQTGRKRSAIANILKCLLLPTSMTYGVALVVRKLCYALGLCRSKRLSGRVISVGNITTGGTGKTPVTLLLGEWLTSRGVEFGILSRGYRSGSEDSGSVFRNSDSTNLQISALGDEVALMARRLPNVWFGIGKNRHEQGMTMNEQHNINMFVLDDGFQHLQLRRDCDIVLIDASNPWGNGFLFPAGSLREPLSSIRRAQLILVTRSDLVSALELEELTELLLKYHSSEQVFFMKTAMRHVSDLLSGKVIERSQVDGKRVSAFAGIGNPDSFRALLNASGLDVVSFKAFDDHHEYTMDDLSALRQYISDNVADLLITTEKDAVKLPRDYFRKGECLVAQISFAFVERKDIFWGKIAEVFKC